MPCASVGETCVASVVGAGHSLPWVSLYVGVALGNAGLALVLFVVMLVADRRKPELGPGLAPNYGIAIAATVRVLTSINLLLGLPPLGYYFFYHDYDPELACNFVSFFPVFPLVLMVITLLIIVYYFTTRAGAMRAFFATAPLADGKVTDALVFPTARGEWAVRLARVLAAARDAPRVTAADAWPSDTVRAWARENVRRAGVDDIVALAEPKLSLKDELPFATASYDLVFTPFILLRLGGPLDSDAKRFAAGATLFHEIARVLRPGARWIFIDFSSRAEAAALHIANTCDFSSAVVSDEDFQFSYKKARYIVCVKDGTRPAPAPSSRGRVSARDRTRLFGSLNAAADATRARAFGAQSWADDDSDDGVHHTENDPDDWELFPSNASLELAITGFSTIPLRSRLFLAIAILIDLGLAALATVAVGAYFKSLHIPRRLRFDVQYSNLIVQALGAIVLFEFIHLMDLFRKARVHGTSACHLVGAYAKSLVSMIVSIVVFQLISFAPPFLLNLALVCSVSRSTLRNLTTGLTVLVFFAFVKWIPAAAKAFRAWKDARRERPAHDDPERAERISLL